MIYEFQNGIFDNGITANGSIDSNEIFDCSYGIVLNSASSTWTSVNDNLIYDNGRGLYHQCPLAAVTGNIFYRNTIGIESEDDLAAHCNAIVANTTAGLVLLINGTFDVINNYWGDNDGPDVDGTGPGAGDLIDTNGHTVLTFDPWAAMNLTATPPAIVADGASLSILDLDCTRNSDGDLMGCNIPDGMPVHFTTTAGTLTSATALLSAGHAVTALRSGAIAGIAIVTSAFLVAPAHTLSTANVTFTAAPVPPPPPPQPPVPPDNQVPNGVNAGAGSHGSSLTSITPSGTLNLPNLQVSAARLSASSIAAGSQVTVSADVTNTGGASGAAAIKVYLNSEVAGSQGVKVAGGSTTPVIFILTPSQPGEYNVRVDNVSAGTLKVTGGNDSDIVFAIAFAAFVVLILSLLVVYLRRRGIAA